MPCPYTLLFPPTEGIASLASSRRKGGAVPAASLEKSGLGSQIDSRHFKHDQTQLWAYSQSPTDTTPDTGASHAHLAEVAVLQ
jgi:hypothetical protein